jgi:hypothetical protein
MKNAGILLAALLMASVATTATAADSPTMVTTVPKGTDDVLFNPGMGLAFCTWAAPPQWLEGKTCWADAISNMVYIRPMWCEVNPEPGIYTFENSDLGRWVPALEKAGRRFAFRIMPTCPMGSAPEDVTPKWVFDRGVPYVPYQGGGMEHAQKFPVIWDKGYLQAMDELVTELARRYDGNPALEFVDVPIGSFGELWFFGDHDEWVKKGYSTDRVISATEDIIDIYRRHFTHTRLAIPLGEGHFQGEMNRERIRNEVLDYCQRVGVMPRQDGLWTDKHWLADYFAAMAPRVGTMYEPVGGILQQPGDTAAIYARALEGKISFFNWYGQRADTIADPTERQRLTDFARKLGYRFTVASVDCVPQVTIGKNRRALLRAVIHWRNDGVAWCHDQLLMRLALIDSAGKVVAERTQWPLHPVDGWDPGKVVDEPVELTVPAEAGSPASLAVGLRTRAGRDIAVALADRRPDGLCPVARFSTARADFEPKTVWQQSNDPEQWRVEKGVTMTLTPNGGPQGGPCLRLSGDDAAVSWSYASVPVVGAVPGGAYVFSGWIKVDSVTRGPVPYLKMDFNNAAGSQVSYNPTGHSENLKRGPDGYPWVKFELKAIAPAAASTVYVAVEKGLNGPAGATVRLAGLQVRHTEMP